MFSVRIQETGQSFAVLPEESVLAAALKQGVYLPWGCGQGLCGTCMGQVLSGNVRYPDGWPLSLFEEDAAQGQALLCVCTPESDLLLTVPELA